MILSYYSVLHIDVVLSDNSEYDRDLDQGHVADDEPQRDIDLDPGDTHEGSVAPLISNTKDMELTSVSLSPEQVGGRHYFCLLKNCFHSSPVKPL